MKKINKQVAKSKIRCFLESNQVVLFFHCKNSVSLNKNDNLLDLNKKQVTLQTQEKGVTSTNGAPLNCADLVPLNISTKESCVSITEGDTLAPLKFDTYKRQVNQNTFKSMMVKNRLAKKAFLELNALKSSAFLKKRNSLYCQKRTLDQFSKKRESLTSSLFQGPILLLGCSDIKMLQSGIDACAKSKGLILLGALYEKVIINHSQIKRVIAFSHKNQGYLRLLSSMNNYYLRPFSLLRNLLSMRSLLVQQEKLIFLLKAREEQILVAKL